MGASLFRSNQPAVLLTVPLLVLALFLPGTWAPVPPIGAAMPLAAWLMGLLGPSSVAHGVAAMVLVAIVAIQAAALLNALELMDRRNHLAALLVPLVLAGLSGPQACDPALMGMPLVLAAFRRAWSINNNGPALQALFDAGLLLAMASLFYLPFAFLLAVIWASVSIIRPFAWREYVLPLLALALVYYIAWAVLVIADRVPWRPLATIAAADGSPFRWGGSAPRTAFDSLLLALLAVAAIAFQASHARSIMRGKNLRSAFMGFALASAMAMAAVWAIKRSFPAVVVAVPAGLLAGYALLQPRRPWLAGLAAWTLLLLTLWLRWMA
jgi:hypothetical protein